MEQLRLGLVTDRGQARGRDLLAVVRACLEAGLPAVQVREKDLGAAEVAALCRALLPAARSRRAWIIVNDRLDVALAVGADAVQRTGSSLAVEDLKTVAAGRVRVGASVHSLEEAVAAEKAGADWVTFGPVYDTPSKRRHGPPQGLRALARVTGALRVPVVAIGGVTPERVAEVRSAGARGVWAISAILAADDPAGATRRFLDALAAA